MLEHNVDFGEVSSFDNQPHNLLSDFPNFCLVYCTQLFDKKKQNKRKGSNNKAQHLVTSCISRRDEIYFENTQRSSQPQIRSLCVCVCVLLTDRGEWTHADSPWG